MYLNQLLKELSYTEFANLAVGESGSGDISEVRIPSVVNSINGALLRIYSKFLHNHKTVVIKKLVAKTTYLIDSSFSESKGASNPYIMDINEPFTDDIIKIVSANYEYDHECNALGVRGEYKREPITLNPPRTLFISDDVPSSEYIYVKYRAKHPEVTYDDNTFIECPPSAFEAIKAYVAYKEYQAMNTDVSVAKGQEYMNQFNTICNELIDRDTIGITEAFRDDRFHQRGFV